MSRLTILLSVLALMTAGCTGSASSSPTTATEPPSDGASSSSDLEPPPVLLLAPDGTVELPGYDYCWWDDSPMAVCADYFGSEIPTPVTIGVGTVAVQWIEGAELSAWLRFENGECIPLLELTGPGQWTLAMPPTPGTYRVDFSGASGESTSHFAIALESTAAGPAVRPQAEVWWPDTTDEFEPSIRIAGAPYDATAQLSVLSPGGVVTSFHFERISSTVGGSDCQPTFLQTGDEAALSSIDQIPGDPPYTVSLLVESREASFEASWQWPDDLTVVDKSVGKVLVGSMQPTSE